MKRSWILMAVCLLAAVNGFAWGEKGHFIVNEAATHAVPAEMPTFFHQAYPVLVELGPEPDRWRGAGESLDAVNPPEHFLDYEYVEDLDLPSNRYRYIELLQKSGTLDRYGIRITTPGFLPWRIAEVCELLEEEWRMWRHPNLLPAERQRIETAIIFNAGILGHYVGDAANPDHTTINYNGWVGVPNTENYPTDCDSHFRFETWFVTHTMDVSKVVPLMAPPTERTDYFRTAMGEIAESNAQVETLYRIDRDGGFEGRIGTEEARSFAARRLAAGASMLRDLWWSTWVNSAGRPVRD